MSNKARFKSFFKVREASDAGIELLRMFIVPFSKRFKRLGVDDVLSMFFAIDDRKIVYLKANRDFKLPGKYLVRGNRPVYGIGPRAIKKNQVLLCVVDKQEGTAKIEAVINKAEHNYLLEKFEFETIKDWVDVVI